MPGIWQSREFLLAQNTRGDEQLTAKRQQVCTLLTAAAVMLAQLPSRHETDHTGVSVGEEMTADDILTAQRNALTILDILCPDGDYGSPEVTRIHAYMTMADIHFDRNEWDTGLRHLETAVTLAVYLDTDYDGTSTHTSPLLRGLVYGDYITNLPDNFSLSLLKQLEKKPFFEALAANETGAVLLASLEEHAAIR